MNKYLTRNEVTEHLQEFINQLTELSKTQKNQKLANLSNALNTYNLYLTKGYSSTSSYHTALNIIED